MQRKLHDGLHLGSISRRRRGPFHCQNQCTWSCAAGESDACPRDLSVLSHAKHTNQNSHMTRLVFVKSQRTDEEDICQPQKATKLFSHYRSDHNILEQRTNFILNTQFLTGLRFSGSCFTTAFCFCIFHVCQGGSPSPFDRIQATRQATLAVNWLTERIGENLTDQGNGF